MKNKVIVFFTYLLVLHIILGLLFKLISPFLISWLIWITSNLNVIYLIIWVIFTIILFFLGKYYYNRSVDKGFISQEKPTNDILLSIVAFALVPLALFFLFMPIEGQEATSYNFIFLIYIVIFTLFQFMYSKIKK